MSVLDGVRNVVFDFGGVLVDLDRGAAVRAFQRLGVDVSGYVGQSGQGGVFGALERGEMSVEEFCKCVSRMAGRMLRREEVFGAWNSMLTGIPSRRLDVVRSLRGRYGVYLLSNTNAIHWEYSVSVLCRDLVSCFDGVFLSYEMHMVKPDRAVFRAVLRAAGLRACDTLLIDDSVENCSAAEECGMRVFHSLGGGDWLKLFVR